MTCCQRTIHARCSWSASIPATTIPQTQHIITFAVDDGAAYGGILLAGPGSPWLHALRGPGALLLGRRTVLSGRVWGMLPISGPVGCCLLTTYYPQPSEQITPSYQTISSAMMQFHRLVA